MGEIIIKVPGNIKEIVEFSEIEHVFKLFTELKKIKEQNDALNFILKNAGKLSKDFEIPEEDIYLQED